MQDVVALGPDAVDVIANFRKPTVLVRARLVLHELLETVPGQLFVFYVVALVFFCAKMNTTICGRIPEP